MSWNRVLKVLLLLAVLAFPTAYAVGAVTSDPDPVPSRDPIVLPSPSTSPVEPPRSSQPGSPTGKPAPNRPACDDDPDDDDDGVVVVRPCPEDIGDDGDDDQPRRGGDDDDGEDDDDEDDDEDDGDDD
jgi:hypothetical protein